MGMHLTFTMNVEFFHFGSGNMFNVLRFTYQLIYLVFFFCPHVKVMVFSVDKDVMFFT